MTTILPAQIELERTVTGLIDRLRSDWPAVLDDDRWADVRDSIDRLAVPGALPPLAQKLGDAQCRRLAELLLARWAAIDTVTLPPVAAITQDGPGELALIVDGLADGWQATWTGPVEVLDPDGRRVRLADHDDSLTTRVAARVFGRGPDGRVILAARWRPDRAADTDIGSSTMFFDGQAGATETPDAAG